MNAFEMVVIDEAQDMSPAQLLLAQILAGYDISQPVAGQKGGRLAYVGDNAQAIYGFRGADSHILAKAAADLDAEVLSLNITYRCPKKIVELAQRYVPDFVAAQEAPEGEIHEGVLEKFMLEQAGKGDFILCRANAPLMSVCLKLLAQGKRAYMAGRDVGEKLLGILRKVQGKKAFMDMADLELRLERWAEKEREKIARTCKTPEQAQSRYELTEDILGIFHALAEGLEEPAEIEQQLKTLFQEPGLTNKDFICCSTVHKAKGLEADNVWILAQGFQRPGEEEDNIRYVAITRAKKRLYAVGFAFEGGSPKLEEGELEKQIVTDLLEENQPFCPHSEREHEILSQDGSHVVLVNEILGDMEEFHRFGLVLYAREKGADVPVCKGTADTWSEVERLIASWLPDQTWSLNGRVWPADVFARASKHVPKAYAAQGEALDFLDAVQRSQTIVDEARAEFGIGPKTQQMLREVL